MTTEAELLARARDGDRKAQSALLRAAEPGARRLVRLLVGHPDDVNDLMQDALLQAFTELKTLEEGAEFAPFVETLAVRRAAEFLALQRRWRPSALVQVENMCERHELLGEIANVLSDVDVRLDAGSQIAFCFSVVGRSLPLQEATALVLCDVLGFTPARAAEMLRTRVADIERFLDEGRDHLGAVYDRLCGLVNDRAPCDHCRGLWAAAPGHKGPNPERLGLDVDASTERLRRRLRVVREAPLDQGPMRKLHEFLYRLVAENEHNRVTKKELDDQMPLGRFRWQGLLDLNN